MKKYTQKNSDKVKSLRAPAMREPVSGAAKSADNAVKERDGAAERCRLMTVREVAEMLGVSVATVCSMRADGMPCAARWSRCGKNRRNVPQQVLFREADVRAWLAARELRTQNVQAPEIPETEDGVAPGTDIAGACVAGAFFLLCAAGIVYGAVMALIG